MNKVKTLGWMAILSTFSFCTCQPTYSTATQPYRKIRVRAQKGALSKRSDDWPMVRHDAQNTGYTPIEVRPPLKLVWRAYTNMGIAGCFSILLVSGGTVCAGQPITRIYGQSDPQAQLFDSSGHLVWQLPNAQPVYLHGPILIVISKQKNGFVAIAYNHSSRRQLWVTRLDASMTELDPVIEDKDKLYISYASKDAYTNNYAGFMKLVILNVHNGHVLTRYKSIPCQALDDRYIYWGGGHWLRVADKKTLKLLWTDYDSGTVWPISTGRYVVALGWMHWVTAVDTKSRQPIWRVSAMRDNAHCLARGSRGALLAIEDIPIPIALAAIDIPTGKTRWLRPMFAEPGKAAGGRFIYVPGGHEHLPGEKQPKGGFYCLDADTGAVRWKYERTGQKSWGSMMIVGDGAAYGLDFQGYLYKFIPTAKRTQK